MNLRKTVIFKRGYTLNCARINFLLFQQNSIKEKIKFSSVTESCDSVWHHRRQHSRPPVHHQPLEFTQTHVHRVSDAIQPSHPLLSPSPPAFNLSQHQGLLNESAFHIRWPKYWTFSFNISPSSEHPGLISFRMDWLDLLAAQGTLKSLLQHHGSKASILLHSTSFIVQLSHPHGKTWPLEKHDHWKNHSLD